MGQSMWLKVCLVVALFLAVPAVAEASVSVSPSVSTNGAYTVTWTDTSGGVVRAYLAASTNGGAWAKTTVTGTLSKAFTGKAVGTYAYKVQIYLYDAELKKELFDHETNVATVQVTTLAAPGAPGPLTGPARSESGAYSLAWGAASGTVTRYELTENGVNVYSGTALAAALTGRKDGGFTYQARACNAAGCGAWSTSLAEPSPHSDEAEDFTDRSMLTEELIEFRH